MFYKQTTRPSSIYKQLRVLANVVADSIELRNIALLSKLRAKMLV